MPQSIDICDSDEDEGLARRRAAIRRRRQQAEQEAKEAKELIASEEPQEKAVAPARPLPTGPWDCPACGEPNGEKRLKCNNCGKPRPGTEEVVQAETLQPAPPAEAQVEKRKKRNRGWDDWDEQAKKAAQAASAANATLMKDVVNSWKPTVEQLKAMTVAELGPICRSWKISIDPKEYMRDVMISKALKVIHGIENYLCYWNNKAAFEKGEDPKGKIPLLNITKVSISDESNQDVSVKYAKAGEAEPVLLRLSFPSYKSAEQWRQELRNIRATI
ncbi:hypothetical protein AK812_SmicGene1259 [Symbiodinium microadriaticum]|uniref:RanBP2-type domain-containing protein n=1 Tax=Symbiodinium microadriaticum TaxID=2951 RepID=A0A1Q9F4I9_SYMMI|nr:hypothetical protein AK812_SmicGene1259 [Symbiodinium microadriaticum]